MEKAAEDAADLQAKTDAGDVAKRKCPDNCKHKSSTESPDDPEPTLHPATTYFSGLSSERFEFTILGFHIKVDTWRWVADASAEWEVTFSCE